MDDTALVITAWQRPAYLRRVLASWAKVPEFAKLGTVAVALGASPVAGQMAEVIELAARASARAIEVWPDTPGCAAVPGEHRALGEAIGRAERLGAEFIIASSEDVIVSDDVLAYFAWARSGGGADIQAVCAHNEIGQGWHPWYDDSDADQEGVYLAPAFNPWCWGTWADRWREIIEPQWDWDCTTGELATEHGWDWQMHRIIQEQGVAFVPYASRAMNIGQHGGVYANPLDFPKTRAQSFRARRGQVAYRLDSERSHG